MDVTEQEQRILAHVLQMLGSGKPTVQNIEDYLIGYEVLGRLVAIAQGEYELLDQQKKVAWASAFAMAKEDKTSDALAKSVADVQTDDLARKVIRSRERLTNLRNTREAVQEAINAIKYLGRFG